MAKIDALLQHMTQNGTNRAVLNADAPSLLESGAGSMIYEPKSALHLDGSSILFADGHVKWFREQQARTLAPK